MTVCTKHGIEHTQRFPCEEYEKYRQLSTQAHSVTVYETRPVEDPQREGLLGMERVEVGTYESGHVGPARPVDGHA
ncbi:hypothetical protein PP404_25090 [Mycobacteroides abscessus]|nr:hypothetical protein [Mycobacteroides abscessus]MDM2180499.1 hypothetical protein [Mycobacteroides abscessus]MDM2209715.1 hypothetical protein [Mycobacteroides abscessus]MDM2214741.1 hypothetical protein [Mycobacteroides abscessus]MDM2219732.1 hypothetical protein [Mycobacteroides abscessus]